VPRRTAAGQLSKDARGINHYKKIHANARQLRTCTENAARRGSKSIATDDLIFLIRHDQAKVSRLRTFLSWKDVRKNVRDSDDKGGETDIGTGDEPVGAVAGPGPVGDAAKKNKKAKVGLPWEVPSLYNQGVPEREDEEDEDEEDMNYATLQRLRKADERTKAMTKEEYVTWSEYRQASFTFRKGKRFKEWAGFGVVTDSKPNDDIVDILGFLTFEIVQTLTEEALKIKEQEDLYKEKNGVEEQGNKRKAPSGLFDPPSEGKTPVEPRHIQEAFRRLQARPKKSRAMLNFSRGLHRTPLKLVSQLSWQCTSLLIYICSSDQEVLCNAGVLSRSSSYCPQACKSKPSYYLTSLLICSQFR
jgi:transcription initiation protein SPT3